MVGLKCSQLQRLLERPEAEHIRSRPDGMGLEIVRTLLGDDDGPRIGK